MHAAAHYLVDEPGVPCLVARHEREDLRHRGVAGFQAAADLLVEQKAGELGRAAALEELDEDAAGGAADLVGGLWFVGGRGCEFFGGGSGFGGGGLSGGGLAG